MQSPSCPLLSLLLTSTLGWGELPPPHGRGKLCSAQSNTVTFLRLHSCSAAGTCPPKAPWAHNRFLTRAPWGCDSCLSSSQTVSIYKHGLRPALKNQAGARIPASLSEQQASRSGGQDTGFRVKRPRYKPRLAFSGSCNHVGTCLSPGCCEMVSRLNRAVSLAHSESSMNGSDWGARTRASEGCGERY